ncbi:hypothetical protein [Streptomyces sp. NBC_00582]|uniref:hypothetical protein n=1 Tax=Streptomyces sp. NBC_00582 TaxID=2975783 RepID=UPI002E8035D3|nr:hypothetical protein [Streptomyces sp. NBC_00582]WUB60437.1 hypothetical protein OG852_08595 [Streptomyces sp. NBC_00582]
MTEQPPPKPETTGQRMNRLIRELGAPDPNEPLMAAIRHSWAKTTKKENPDG